MTQPNSDKHFSNEPKKNNFYPNLIILCSITFVVVFFLASMYNFYSPGNDAFFVCIGVAFIYYTYHDWKANRDHQKQLYESLDDNINLDEYNTVGKGDLQDLVLEENQNIEDYIQELEEAYFETTEDVEEDLATYGSYKHDLPMAHENDVYIKLIKEIEQTNWLKVEPHPNHSFYESKVITKTKLGNQIYQFNGIYYLFIDHITVDLIELENKCDIVQIACIKTDEEYAHLVLSNKNFPKYLKGEESENDNALIHMSNYYVESKNPLKYGAYPPKEVIELLDHMTFKTIEFYEDNILLSCLNHDPLNEFFLLHKFMPKIRSLYS